MTKSKKEIEQTAIMVMLRKKVSAKKKIEDKAMVEQIPILVMLRKKVSAKKKIEDKALAKKPVADDESGRTQEPPSKVLKKGVESKTDKHKGQVMIGRKKGGDAETVKNQRNIENGRKQGSWRSEGRGSTNIVGDK